MRQRVAVIALALFVAVDVLLVAIAFKHVQSGSPSASSSVSSTPSTSSLSSSTTATSGDSPSATSSSPQSSATPQQVSFLAVGDDRVLLRASRGDCSGQQPPEVSVSTDEGKTFSTGDVSGLSEVVGLRAVSAKDLTVLGLDKTCGPTRWTSTDGGRTWSRAGSTPAWSMGRVSRPATVGSPQGTRTPSCTPAAVSTVDESLVRLLCADGRVLGTDDVGSTWVQIGQLPDGVDIRFSSAGDGVALAKQQGCPAAVVTSVDGGAQWKRLGCLPGDHPRAIGAQGSVIAAQVGPRVYVSTDGGKTWPGASPAAG